MQIDDVLNLLKGLGSIGSIGIAASKLFAWLRGKTSKGNVDPTVQATLDKLPITASAQDVLDALLPLYRAEGGNVSISAGNDGGGNIRMDNPTVMGGAGVIRGGSVSILGGDGGPNGNGGDITIIGGTIKGGDAG